MGVLDDKLPRNDVGLVDDASGRAVLREGAACQRQQDKKVFETHIFVVGGQDSDRD